MAIKTIKDIDEETWTKFRTIAVKQRLKTAQLFKRMVELHENSADAVWEKILHHEPLLTQAEATVWKKRVAQGRKEYGFRT